MEELLVDALGVLVPVVEACGATVIVVGALWACATGTPSPSSPSG